MLILRETTERPEAVNLGISKLVGMDKDLILDSFENFNPAFSTEDTNPYGDGKTSQRIVKILT